LDNDKYQNIKLTAEQFEALTKTQKFKAITAAEIRADKAERRAEQAETKIATIWRHLKSPIIDLIRDLSVDEFDDILSHRIKNERRT
jgi:hypothetical protein